MRYCTQSTSQRVGSRPRYEIALNVSKGNILRKVKEKQSERIGCWMYGMLGVVSKELQPAMCFVTFV